MNSDTLLLPPELVPAASNAVSSFPNILRNFQHKTLHM